MKILHVINSFGIGGGAERLVANTINAFPDDQHALIILNYPNTALKEVHAPVQVYNLLVSSKLSQLKAILKIRTLIKKTKPDIIHSHLPLATNLVRLANKLKTCPHVFSVHNMLTQSLQNQSKILFLLERMLYRKIQSVIYVSDTVKQDYRKFVAVKGNEYVLKNFIEDQFYSPENHKKNLTFPLRKFIAVGSLKDQKNYFFLIDLFQKIKKHGFTLDIYGKGPQKNALEEKIRIQNADNVRLKGNSSEIAKILKHYDAYIMLSKYEGFGIAPIEAAAVGLPIILSDIPVLREVTKHEAFYLSIENINESAEQLNNFSVNQDLIIKMQRKVEEVSKSYSQLKYFDKLKNIYSAIINKR